jgi:hypothetical protein
MLSSLSRWAAVYVRDGEGVEGAEVARGTAVDWADGPTLLAQVHLPNCTAPSLIPTVNGNTVRSFSTHGQRSAAKGSSTTVSAWHPINITYITF